VTLNPKRRVPESQKLKMVGLLNQCSYFAYTELKWVSGLLFGESGVWRRFNNDRNLSDVKCYVIIAQIDADGVVASV